MNDDYYPYGETEIKPKMTETLQDKIDSAYREFKDLDPYMKYYANSINKAIQELREEIVIMHDNATPYHRKRPLENTPEYYLMQVLALIGEKK